ncbi:MAG: hypothetical protein K0U54_01115 [Bacteroidetes bacterium]|nr:hypothetical protein [Bacteroidota bacterium]
MKNIILICLSLTLLISCNNDDNGSGNQQQDAKALTDQLNDIFAIANGVSCKDASQWEFVSFGKKACGGPVGYVAYATTIDVAAFLENVEAHRTAEDQFNMRWGIVSTCDIPAMPLGVDCQDGEAILVYQ